jgi:glutamate N-acetyltransferase/amino-acid N-acetyltransferase
MTVYKKAITPRGFVAGAIACGIKRRKPDLAVFFSLEPAVAAVVATKNKVKAAPLIVNARHMAKSRNFQAIVVNSGNANCFTGAIGIRDAESMASYAAQGLCLQRENVLVASTGVIGRRLPIAKIRHALPRLIFGLSEAGVHQAARAIMTTDTFAKCVTARCTIGAQTITICGVAKGSGMIAPNMATMLGFILTDAAITQRALDKALTHAVERSFNCISVDNCMSTNDTVITLANGLAGNARIDGGKGLAEFTALLHDVCLALAQMIARDGEGATKFITIKVSGAKNFAEARTIGLAVAKSDLFKTAIYGESPNFFGRVIAAVGTSQASIDVRAIKIKASPLQKKDITVTLSVGAGHAQATVYTCDLTHGYIKINTEYN